MEERKEVIFTIDDARNVRLKNLGSENLSYVTEFIETLIQVAKNNPQNHYIGNFDDARKNIDADEAITYYEDGKEEEFIHLLEERYRNSDEYIEMMKKVEEKNKKIEEQNRKDANDLLDIAIRVGEDISEEQIMMILRHIDGVSSKTEIFQSEEFKKFIDIISKKYESIEKTIISEHKLGEDWNEVGIEHECYFLAPGLNVMEVFENSDKVAKVMIGQLLNGYNKGEIPKYQIGDLTLLYFDKLDKERRLDVSIYPQTILSPEELKESLKSLIKNEEKTTISLTSATKSLIKGEGVLDKVGEVDGIEHTQIVKTNEGETIDGE